VKRSEKGLLVSLNAILLFHPNGQKLGLLNMSGSALNILNNLKKRIIVTHSPNPLPPVYYGKLLNCERRVS
jgi:hypothetical protein